MCDAFAGQWPDAIDDVAFACLVFLCPVAQKAGALCQLARNLHAKEENMFTDEADGGGEEEGLGAANQLLSALMESAHRWQWPQGIAGG